MDLKDLEALDVDKLGNSDSEEESGSDDSDNDAPVGKKVC